MLRTHLVPVVLSRWPFRKQGLHWGSVSGAHLGVLVSADIQGCLLNGQSFEIAADVKDYNAIRAHSDTEVLNHSGSYR